MFVKLFRKIQLLSVYDSLVKTLQLHTGCDTAALPHNADLHRPSVFTLALPEF